MQKQVEINQVETKVLVTNVHSSYNAGDAALASISLQQLKSCLPNVVITLAMDDPESYLDDDKIVGSYPNWVQVRSASGKKQWHLWRLLTFVPSSFIPAIAYRLIGRPVWFLTPISLRELVKAYIEADLVVSEAGGFIYHSGHGLTLLISIYTLFFALLLDKPLYILPQSIGPLPLWWERLLVVHVLNKARLVITREPISFDAVSKWGVSKKRLHLLPDLAFTFESDTAESARKCLYRLGVDVNNDRPLLGLTVVNWGAQNRDFHHQTQYEASIQAVTVHFIRQYGGKVIFFPQVIGPAISQDDRIPAKRIVEGIENWEQRQRIIVIEEKIPDKQLKSLYGEMDLFIGTRMHSNIFALSKGVPAIAIGYQHKTLGTAKMLGIEKWIIDIDSVEPEKLTRKLDELWEAREEVQAHLKRVIPKMVTAASQAGELAFKDYLLFKMTKMSKGTDSHAT